MNSDKTDDYLIRTLQFLEICVPVNLLAEMKKATCEDLLNYHFGFGMWLRNNILNKTSGLYDYFVCTGVKHPDDMSSIITINFHQYLNNPQAKKLLL